MRGLGMGMGASGGSFSQKADDRTAWPWLPYLLRRIAENFDLETALEVAREFGGTRIRLPRTARESHPIAQQFSLVLLRFMIDCNGPGDCVIPLGPAANAHRRRDIIHDLTRKGCSNNDIARWLHIHERTVRTVRAKLRAENRL